jgi:hypothetical protein
MVAAVAVAALAWVPVPAVAGDSWQRVAGVKQVSEDTLFSPHGCQPDTEVEPAIAMDPSDPNVVLSVFQVGRCEGGAAAVGYAGSRDGGRTWSAGFTPLWTKVTGGPFERGDDPAVAFGPDGTAYIVEMGFNQGRPCRSAVAVQRSDDHGVTFGPPMFVQDDCQTFNDKTWIAVDTYPSSPFFGRVYVAWLSVGQPYGIVLKWSDDRGQTWSPLITVTPPGAAPEGAFPLVQPNGDLTIVFMEHYPFGPMGAMTSRDGGNDFEEPVKIADVHAREPEDIRTGDGIPSGSVDPSTGNLYVVWQDKHHEPTGTNNAVLSRSNDGGHTWSPIIRVNPPNADRPIDHFSPAVAASGGWVHVSYWTRVRRPGTAFDTVRLNEISAAASDLAFGPELTLGPEGDLAFAARSGRQRFLGDYLGLAANGDAVHAVWCLPTPGEPGTLHTTAWSGTVLR